MHCSRRRLLRRGLEFHVCTIKNKSVLKVPIWKKSGNLFNVSRIYHSIFSTFHLSHTYIFCFVLVCSVFSFMTPQPVNKRNQLGTGIRKLYLLYRVKTPTLKTKSVLHMTLNCIQQWGYSSGDLESMEYLFIAITSRSTPEGVELVRTPPIDQKVLFKKYLYLKRLLKTM